MPVFVNQTVRWSLLEGGQLRVGLLHRHVRREQRGAGRSELPTAADVPYASTDATNNVLGMPVVVTNGDEERCGKRI